MTGRYKAYPKYKGSGVRWLGDIPSDWNVIPLKHLSTLTPKKSGINKQKMSEYCSFVPMDKLKLNSLKLDESKLISDVYDGYTYFENEDVLIAKVTPCFENKNMAVAKNLLNGIGFGSSEIYVLRTNSKLNNQFLFYRLQEDGFMEIATAAMSGAGGLKRIPAEAINAFLAAFPSYEEQQTIANFLDHETAKIDTLITKQEKLIELLKEKRQAVISHAVTKGLNPDVPMKDSGVEWLGEVPEHWITSKLKNYTIQIVDGAHFTPTYTESGVPFLRVTDVTSKTIDFNKIKFIPEDEHKELIKRCSPQKGDLLLSKNGTIGVPKVIDWDYDFSIFVSLCLIKFKTTLLSTYSYYVFESHQIAEQINGGIKQSTVINLHLDKIENFYFSIPPIDEQQLIVDELDRITQKFDALIAKAEDGINLMKERKTALISAAVTGKIDVRDWQAKESNE